MNPHFGGCAHSTCIQIQQNTEGLELKSCVQSSGMTAGTVRWHLYYVPWGVLEDFTSICFPSLLPLQSHRNQPTSPEEDMIQAQGIMRMQPTIYRWERHGMKSTLDVLSEWCNVSCIEGHAGLSCFTLNKINPYVRVIMSTCSEAPAASVFPAVGWRSGLKTVEGRSRGPHLHRRPRTQASRPNLAAVGEKMHARRLKRHLLLFGKKQRIPFQSTL